MSDIFISYAHEDRARVQPLAAALERRGWSVWWDPDIRTGQDFDNTIAAALQAAGCVIVVWSYRSVDRPWVKDEAEVGRQRGVLVPVRIDAVERPLGFGRLQTADLIGWDGTSPHAEIEKLIADIANILERRNLPRGGPQTASSAIVEQTVTGAEPLHEEPKVRRNAPTAPESTSSQPIPIGTERTTAPSDGRPLTISDIVRRHRVLFASAVAAVALVAYALSRRAAVPPETTDGARTVAAISVRTPEAPVSWPTPDDRVAQEVGRCRSMWKSQEEARAANPGKVEILATQADCAMLLLDYIRISGDKARFSDVVDTLTPVLHQAVETAHGARAADLMAHLGWADFLKSRDGEGGLEPAGYYRRALEQDADNPFANAMWGHWILWQRGSLAEAQAHFSRALGSGRERDLVRRLQLAALTLYVDPPLEFEAIRVANEMRGNLESPPTNDPERHTWSKYWNIYYDHLLNGNQKEAFLAILPASEHLATFRWLFPESQMPQDKLRLWILFVATFQELSGDRIAARSNYDSLRADLMSQHASGPILVQTEAALRRLSVR